MKILSWNSLQPERRVTDVRYLYWDRDGPQGGHPSGHQGGHPGGCWDCPWQACGKDLRGSIKVVKLREGRHRWELSLQGSRVKILRSFTFFFFWNMNPLGAHYQHILYFASMKAWISTQIVKKLINWSMAFRMNYLITTSMIRGGVWTNNLCYSRTVTALLDCGQ